MSESPRPDGQKRPADLEDDLGRWLRAEAADRRPAFSEALHARIMGAVASSPPTRRIGGWWSTDRQRRWLAGTVAGALAVAVMLVAWQSGIFAPTEPEPTVAEAMLDPAQVLTGTDSAQVGRMVDQTLAQSQWAYLDHDAKIAASLLLEQLPFELASSEQP